MPHFHTPPCNPKSTKEPIIPVRTQLLDLMIDDAAVISTGGQIFVHLDAPGGLNCFTVPLLGDHYKSTLTVRRTSQSHDAPSDNQIRQALRIKEAACFAGTTRHTRIQMNVRCAWDANHAFPNPQTDESGNTTYDFLNADTEPAYVIALDTVRGRHVAITSKGWTIHRSQTPFVFHPLQQAQPDPVQSSDPDAALQPFRQLLRLEQPRHDETWNTLLQWTLSALRAPKDPGFHSYPILNLTGPEASGKSVAARLLTKLLDPTLTPIHAIPSTERRLHSLAAAHHILTFDDAGKVNPEKSRYLSRLSSGVTSLHKDLQGVLVRPIILTTAEETDTRHLASKVVDIELPPIEQSLPPEQINQQFEAIRPQTLGALLTLLSLSLDTPPPFLPNRKTKSQKLEESVTNFLNLTGGQWKGTITDLVVQTLVCAPSPKALSKALETMTSITYTKLQRKNKQRPIHLALKPKPISNAKESMSPKNNATLLPLDQSTRTTYDDPQRSSPTHEEPSQNIRPDHDHQI